MNNQNNEKSYKVLILGNQGTGKTAIANAVSLFYCFRQVIFQLEFYCFKLFDFLTLGTQIIEKFFSNIQCNVTKV